MNSVSLVFVVLLSATSVNAQVGQKAEEITIAKPLGKLTLHHCEVVAVLPDGVRVKHDEGTSKIPLEALPPAWKPSVVSAKAVADAAKKMEDQQAHEAAQKQYEETHHREIERAQRIAEAREYCDVLVKQRKVSKYAVENWFISVAAHEAMVGMPEQVAILAFPWGVKKTVFSDGRQIWQVRGGTLYFKDGVLTSWVMQE